MLCINPNIFKYTNMLGLKAPTYFPRCPLQTAADLSGKWFSSYYNLGSTLVWQFMRGDFPIHTLSTLQTPFQSVAEMH